MLGEEQESRTMETVLALDKSHDVIINKICGYLAFLIKTDLQETECYYLFSLSIIELRRVFLKRNAGRLVDKKWLGLMDDMN